MHTSSICEVLPETETIYHYWEQFIIFKVCCGKIVPCMIFICKLLNANQISRGSFLRILYCLFSHICFILQSFGESWHLCCGLLRVSGQVEFVCFIFFLSILAQFKLRFIWFFKAVFCLCLFGSWEHLQDSYRPYVAQNHSRLF